jgi:uncharacterized protein (TIGR02246 family)
MKKIFFSLILIPSMVIINACQNAAAPTEADEAAIRQEITENFKAAWDKNDEIAMAATFLEDGDLAFPTSNWVRGRVAVTDAFKGDLPPGRSIQLDIQDIRFLEPTVALVNVDASFRGGADHQGNPLSDDWDCATWVMQKQQGEWKTAAIRVMPMRQNREQTEQDIAGTWEQFITHWEAGDMEQAMAYFTERAVNLGTNTPERVGRKEITAMMEEAIRTQKPSNLTIDQHTLHILGPVAFQYGTFSQTWTDQSGKSSPQKGRFMTQLRRESDSVWRFHRFMFTTVPAE